MTPHYMRDYASEIHIEADDDVNVSEREPIPGPSHAPVKEYQSFINYKCSPQIISALHKL